MPAPRRRLLRTPGQLGAFSLGLGIMLFGSTIVAGCGGITDPSEGSGPVPARISFAPIVGDWIGTVTENSGLSYTVQMKFSEGSPLNALIGTDVYSGAVNCGGQLRNKGVSGSVYTVEEHITTGVLACVDGATIVLTYDAAAGTLDYSWRHPNTGQGQATAVLTRKQ